MVKRIQRSHHRRIEVRRRLRVERLTDRRVLAAIMGEVFEDLNFSLRHDASEPAAASRLLYLDINDNAQLDVDEPIALAGNDGSFTFDGLADGSYVVRMFNRTDTQIQTFPIEAETSSDLIEISAAGNLIAGDSGPFALTSDSVVRPDFANGTSSSIAVGNQLAAMQSLPDGRLLVVGTDVDSGDTSWIVDPATESVTRIDLTDPGPTGFGPAVAWGQLAIDGDGYGVLLEQPDSDSSPIVLRMIDPVGGVHATSLSTTVPADTRVLSSATGVRSVFASSTSDGLSLSLWSNKTATLISTFDVSGTTELLAFDDSSGLVALRTVDGISVHDVDDNFRAIYSVSGDIGPIVLDGPRDLLVTYSPVDAAMKLIDLRDATVVADLAIDLSSVGQVAALAKGDTPDSLIVLGSAGLHEVKLSRPSAHRVTITGGQDVDSILFGIAETGSNAAPVYDSLPTLQTDEDASLSLEASAALAGSSDSDGNGYVVVQRSSALHGTATARTDGSLEYVPDADFYGDDTFTVVLHDGQTVSAEYTLTINVQALPDSPTGVIIDILPVPEDTDAGTPIGTIEINDVDGGGHIITIDDPRFIEQDGVIIFIGGDINYEDQSIIPLNVGVTDPQTGDTINSTASVRITDANDPITAITPITAFVFENSPGDVVTELTVHDEDEEQLHNLTVDDERFIIENFDLRLADGVAVNYETEHTIVVHVTATEFFTGGTFTQEITISVRDVPEQPTGLDLTPRSVIELQVGDEAGEILIDDGPPDARFELTVDDTRFEIDGATLKLRDDVFVDRAVQSEIQVLITATDSLGAFSPIEKSFVIEVLGNESPLHNGNDPYDVDHGGDVTPIDALVIINYLNIYGPGPVGSGGMGFCYDVNADGFITALDALLVLNRLNRRGGGTVGGESGGNSNSGGTSGGENGGEGEQVPTQSLPPEPIQGIRGQQIADDSTDVPSLNLKDRDALFVRWTVQSRKTTDIIADLAATETDPSPTDLDETLRLLSDENA